jgi:uncharacterized protein involved in outer membrane biogenesis
VNRVLKFILIAAGSLAVLAIAAVAVVLLTFDPNRYKPDIEAAVQQATGRALTINGKLGVAVSLTPTLRCAPPMSASPTRQVIAARKWPRCKALICRLACCH